LRDRFGGFQHVKAAAVQEERMIPENAAQLPLRRMIIGKHLSLKLVQSPVLSGLKFMIGSCSLGMSGFHPAADARGPLDG
jgi:hypothetical protein